MTLLSLVWLINLPLETSNFGLFSSPHMHTSKQDIFFWKPEKLGLTSDLKAYMVYMWSKLMALSAILERRSNIFEGDYQVLIHQLRLAITLWTDKWNFEICWLNLHLLSNIAKMDAHLCGSRYTKNGWKNKRLVF